MTIEATDHWFELRVLIPLQKADRNIMKMGSGKPDPIAYGWNRWRQDAGML